MVDLEMFNLIYRNTIRNQYYFDKIEYDLI